MEDTNGNTVSRDSTTPPPFASATTRNSLAWLMDGAPVNFTRQVAEAAVSERDSASRYSTDTCTTERHRAYMDQVFQWTEPPHLQLDLPSNTSTPCEALTRSATLGEPVALSKYSDAAIKACPILANEVVMKANPRGPRQRKWPAMVRRHWWW